MEFFTLTSDKVLAKMSDSICCTNRSLLGVVKGFIEKHRYQFTHSNFA